MTTKTIDNDRADTYLRPAAQFNHEGQLEIRASAASNCRRALWYSATGYEVTNPPTKESLTVMETGNALEPVVLRAMERAGWEVIPSDPKDPQAVSVQLGPNLKVTGHPDATGVMPLFGGEAVIEVKTRGPSAFKRWHTLGAERSHPASVAQAAIYTYGSFGEARDVVIATMDTGSRQWDYEGDTRSPGCAGPGSRQVVAVSSDRASRPARRRPGRSAGAGFLCHQLAVQILPLSEHLPAGDAGRERDWDGHGAGD